jgi:hypothetical protein
MMKKGIEPTQLICQSLSARSLDEFCTLER